MEISPDKFDLRSKVLSEQIAFSSDTLGGSLGGGRGGRIPHTPKAGTQLPEATEGDADPRMDTAGFGFSFRCGPWMSRVGGGVRVGKDPRDDTRLL